MEHQSYVIGVDYGTDSRWKTAPGKINLAEGVPAYAGMTTISCRKYSGGKGWIKL